MRLLLGNRFRRGWVCGRLGSGKEEELAAKEKDEGEGEHGANADKRLLGRGTNDELDLIDRAGQPWCRIEPSVGICTH